jgi:hypothetical protein
MSGAAPPHRAAPSLVRARVLAQRLGSGDAQPEGREQCSGRRSPLLGPWMEPQRRGQNTQAPASAVEDETGALIAAVKQAKAEALAQGAAVEEKVEAPATPRVVAPAHRAADDADDHALDAVCSWLLSLGLRESVVENAQARLRQEEIFSVDDLYCCTGARTHGPADRCLRSLHSVGLIKL